VRAGGFATEADLAAVVVGWFRAAGATVYQEVEHRGGVADIVAVRDGVLTVVECKLGMNLHVLEQAHRWVGRAHRTYAAVPALAATTRHHNRFAGKVCGALGIGILEVVVPISDEAGRVRIATPAAEHAVVARPDGLASVLRPEHETFAAAGTSGGPRFTPFRATAVALAGYVATHPGVGIREALRAVPTHWAKLPSMTWVAGLIGRGIVPGCRVEGAGKQRRLYPTDAPLVEHEPADTVPPGYFDAVSAIVKTWPLLPEQPHADDVEPIL
jgi:hypothetical protein